ncbi:type VII secretion target [Schaalia hyovaginalis]|uniref:Uncharacterized protein YukE n=1 Tax=Schaalia hyovaginalis TaxID=29316 RepID=A0A923E7L4_9ACTO|nr:type VII secretion target [Schaalia hyovaginalis]MBB6334979.1 uncharacterized protein YukE [Schaalia hyovaginalis]MDY2669561.1 type VII secretion target [Schaalia hyovaginalis]
MTDIDISTDILRTAAYQADSAASQINTARIAAGQALADNAFGLMCSPLLLPLYAPFAAAADAMMSSAASAVSSAAANLRETADDFEDHDDQLVHAFHSVEL